MSDEVPHSIAVHRLLVQISAAWLCVRCPIVLAAGEAELPESHWSSLVQELQNPGASEYQEFEHFDTVQGLTSPSSSRASSPASGIAT